MTAQLFIDSLVAVNLVVSLFLTVLISLLVTRLSLSALQKRQAHLLTFSFFPTMAIISSSHASWINAPWFLGPIELLLTTLIGPFLFDLIYGRLSNQSLLPPLLSITALIMLPIILFANTDFLLALPATFTAAAMIYYVSRKGDQRDSVINHVFAVALTVQLAQLLRFFGSDISWLEEIVPFTATLLGLVYLCLVLGRGHWRLIQEKQQDVSREIFEAVDNHIRQHRLYLDPTLTVAKVASELDLPSYIVSQAVNQHLGRFNDYINKLRVAAFLERYTDQSNVGALAQQVGFNSRSAFYRAFKTETGTIPSKYAL